MSDNSSGAAAQAAKTEQRHAEQQRGTQQSLSAEQRQVVERLQRLYKADHQAEYLYIQAEVDSLFIQLERAKAQQQAMASAKTMP